MRTFHTYFVFLSVAMFLGFGVHTTAFASPPLRSVEIANTPLDVNVANTPVREPDSMYIQLLPTAAQEDQPIYTVEDGKRFMIETVSVIGEVDSSVNLLRLGIIRNGGPARAVWIPMFKQGEADGKTYWVGTERVRMDVRPNEGVRFFLKMSGVTGRERFDANVFGYLIPESSPSLAP